MYQAIPSFLVQATAMPASGTAYVGAWQDVSSGLAHPLTNPIAFWLRQQSVGTPSLLVQVDYSPFRVLPISANAGFSSDPYGGPDANYLTATVVSGFVTVWDGSAAGGGWTQEACPAGIKLPFCSIRYRITVSSADATAVDLVMLRVSGAC